MKECELCSAPARMYCESDQASLCWDCDSKVHCANFLVARHSRSLLCHACQSVTPWQASGAKLGPTVSLCERCMKGCDGRREERSGGVAEEESHGGNQEDEDDDGSDGSDDDGSSDDGNGNEDDDGYGGSDDDDDDDDEDGENQVVPLSSTPPPPPPIASCSSSEESSSRFCSSSGTHGSRLKRMQENVDLGSQDDLCYSSTSQPSCYNTMMDEEATSFTSIRSLKQRKRAVLLRTTQRESSSSTQMETEASSAALISSLKRLERSILSAGADEAPSAIIRICEQSKDPTTAVDLLSSFSPNRPI